MIYINNNHEHKADDTVHTNNVELDESVDPEQVEIERLAVEAREQYLERQARDIKDEPKKTKFPKWIIWVMTLFLLMNTLAFLPQTLSIPVIQFLKTSTILSQDDAIKSYKKAVTLIATDSGSGTGFAINDQGTVLTNSHVVDGYNNVSVYFKDDGLVTGEVIHNFPDIDLAVVQTKLTDNPFLTLASTTTFSQNEYVQFIGNPLRFLGIANEGSIIDYVELQNWEQPVIMIQAPVYRGNSGSPIINEQGEVIGIIFATLDTDEYGKVGLFVPIDYYYEKMRN